MLSYGFYRDTCYTNPYIIIVSINPYGLQSISFFINDNKEWKIIKNMIGYDRVT